MVEKVISIRDGILKTGAPIPQTGIYFVRHSAHRLPAEVTLVQGHRFPRCEACEQDVVFRLVRRLDRSNLRFHVHLYQLPIIEDSGRVA